MLYSRVMADLNSWLDEEENNDKDDLHDLNGFESNNDDFSVIKVDSDKQNLIRGGLEEEEEFHFEEVPIQRRRVGPPKKN